MISFAVAGWSAFTALTAAAWSYASLLVIRLIFGGLEAALSPSVASAFGRWIPEAERSTAFGAFLSGGQLGAALTPPMVTVLMLKYGWRVSFVVFGASGSYGLESRYAFYRNRPEEHPRILPGELGIDQFGNPGQSEAKAQTGMICFGLRDCGVCLAQHSDLRFSGNFSSPGSRPIFGSTEACPSGRFLFMRACHLCSDLWER